MTIKSLQEIIGQILKDLETATRARVQSRKIGGKYDEADFITNIEKIVKHYKKYEN